MRVNLFATLKHAMLASSILLASCTTDLYEEKPEPEPNPGGSTSGIPDGFDFSVVTNKHVTVNVMDEFEGKYYYTIEILTSNPMMDENAKVLAGGKTNKLKPFEVELVCPKELKELYIRQIDPFGLKKIWSFEMKDGNMVCDLKSVAAPESKAVSQLRAGEKFESEDGVSFDPGSAVVVSDEDQLLVNGTYVIPAGKVVEIKKTKTGSVKLYVEGTLKITNELTLNNKSEIYVIPGGSVVGNNSGTGKLTCENGSRIFNSGSIDLNKIELDENTNGYDCVLYNIGEIALKELQMDGTRIFNYCLLNVENRIDLVGAGSNIYLKKGAILCKHIFVDITSNIYVYAKTLFVAEQQVKIDKEAILTVYGENGLAQSDYALFKTAQINVNPSWHFIYYWGVEIATKKSSEIALNGVSEGQATTEIDKSSCNNNTGNNPDKEDPDTKPEFPETNTVSYTYMFEDNWPVFGDYDMNDLVMDVNIANTLDGDNNATSVTITTTLRAVGATKNIYAYAQIEAEGANNISVPLLHDKEAHAALTGEAGNANGILNTLNYNCDSQVFVNTIPLSGVKGRVTAQNLNVYIVWGDPNSTKRNEVHLPTFKGTAKAAPAGKKGYKYDGTAEGANSDYDNMMWGLMIPTVDFMSYPKETIKIFDAYPSFKQWIMNGGGDEVGVWYKNGVQDKLYQGKPKS